MLLRRDPSLIPLSHDHHHGLVRVFEIRRALRAGQDLDVQAEDTRRFYQQELTPHFRAEEEVVFPAIRAATATATTEAALSRLVDEHRQMRDMVGALDASTQRLGAFADLLERHIRFEERELFPAYQERVAPAARSAVEEEVRRILNRPDDQPRACTLPNGAA
jgi:hemerythrin-like domain-containing protein